MDAVSSSSALVRFIILASCEPIERKYLSASLWAKRMVNADKAGRKRKTHLKFQANAQPGANYLLKTRKQKNEICVFLRALNYVRPLG